ncbi:MAG: hypothetical protein WD969_12465 [Paracoccaceae bacterium]
MQPAFLIAALAAAVVITSAPAGANEFDRPPEFTAPDELAALEGLDAFRARSGVPYQDTFRDASSLCDLSDETISAIVYQRPAAERHARGASMPEVKVLSGACVDGALSGPFRVLILREAEPSEAPVVAVVTEVEGAMENGALSGLVQSVGSRYESDNWGALPAYFSFRHAMFSGGALSGVLLSQDFVPVVEGGFVRRTMTLRVGSAPGAFVQRRFLGARLDAVVSFVNGVPEGTAQYPSRETGPKVVCMSGGQVVKEEAC